MKKLLLATAICLSPPATQAAPMYRGQAGLLPTNPGETLALHGFLSRAQMQCGFNGYSDRLMKAAIIAYHLFGETEAMKYVMAGAKHFDAEEAQIGRSSECATIAYKFSGFVQP